MLKTMLGERILKFVSVGVINTLIDFGIFNVLSTKRFGLTKIRANLISTTIAMLFSFFANQLYVFQARGGNLALQITAFFIVTAFGLYVLQNLVIHFLTKVWTWPIDLANKIVKLLGLSKIFNKDFVAKNLAKVVATVVSLTWNYILYQGIVYKL